MNWLLDLVEDHRAAVRYDLLKHDRRLGDLGSAALPWSDAVTFLTEQPPDSSAVWRALHPQEHQLSATTLRLDRLQERLEMLLVTMVQLQLLTGNQSEITVDKLPVRFDQLFEEEKPQTDPTALLTFDEVNERMALIGGEAWQTA